MWLATTELCECICMLFMYVPDDYWQSRGKNFFFIQEKHTIDSWNNTLDAHFTQLRFEAPQASVIYLYISG